MQSRLTGTVTDNTGAVIVGATLTARNVATGVTHTAVTSQSGTYNFPFLPPGTYELRCEFSGFKRAVQSGIVLETGFARTVNLQLEVGDLVETVNVEGSSPLLESENATVGQFIERTTVFNMPVESRRSASLVRLMGAIVYRQEAGAEQIPQFSMAGGRSHNQMWQLDGGITQNMALGVPQLSLNPPAESLQEFKAEANNYAAEFGRAGGGLILMTTRSGTNRYHGAAYEFFRNDKLDTRTFFAPSVAPLRYNIFGASLGGPIRKDRTFFFANYEGARRRDGSTIANTSVPHPGEVAGDFSRRVGLRLMDPMNRQPFPNNIIPSSRIDPIARAFAQFYPLPNTPDNDVTRPPRNNYLTNVSDALTQDYVTVRVDHHLRESDRLFTRIAWVRAPQSVAKVFPEEAADFRAGIRENKHTNIVGSWFHSFTPTLINEARYMYGNRLHINRASGTGSGVNGQIGLPGVNPNAFARINVTGISPLGSGQHERVQTPILTQQFSNILTWVKSKHQIKTGLEFRYSRNQDDFNQSFGGQFTFSDRATGEGLATLLLGWTTSAALVDTDLLNARTDYWGAFIQDDWKVTPKLTLNLGLRWDMDTPRWETNNRQSGFDTTAINPVSGRPGIVTFSGRDGRSKYSHDFDKNNFGPRFGFAYRGSASTVIRGGYGISYLGAYARAVPFALFNGFSLSGSFTSPDGGFTPAFLLRAGMPPIEREELTPGFGAVAVGRAPRLSPDFFQQTHLNGYSQQFNLTIQRQLPENMLVEIAYLGNLGHKLGGPDVNLNMTPLVNGRGPARQSQLDRPFPHFNDVVLKSPSWGNSSYHAANIKFEKRYSNGLNFLMNYTWSKFIDDVEAANELGGEQGNGYTHIELRGLDKALSGNDVRHRYVASAVYELPIGKGRPWNIANRVLNHIVGGWGVGIITELRSGAPYGVVEQTNVTNTFSHSQRPNLLRDPTLSSDRPRSELLAEYFDTSAFQAPGEGVFGNAPRNLGSGPGFIGIDFSAHKWWNLTERFRTQFRGDFFNLPNRPNFANPALLRGRADFGRIAAVLPGSTGRQIQLALRVEF